MTGSERGYAMAALLAALGVMAVMLSVAMPTWRTMVQREREAELVFRGEQYVQAIELFSRRTGGFPTSLTALREGRFIRKLYRDPITDLDFQPVFLGQVAAGGPGAVPGVPGQAGAGGRGAQPAGGTPAGRGVPGTAQMPTAPFGRAGAPGAAAGPIVGVASRSTAQSLRLYNGRNRYNEWLFVSTAATRQPGAPTPGGPNTAPPGRGGRGPTRGRGVGPSMPGPSRGFPPPGGPGRSAPFGGPTGFPPPSSPNQPGRL